MNDIKEQISGKYVIFSDVHGDIKGLERFFSATEDMEKKGYACLGDVTHNGENYSESQCIQRVSENADYWVKGNHEESSKDSSTNHYHQDILGGLSHSINLGRVLLYHSSLRQKDARLTTEGLLQEEYNHIRNNYPDVRFAFFGHTHKRCAFSPKSSYAEDKKIGLSGANLVLINPGHVSSNLQGDDEEPGFAIMDFDGETLNFLSVSEAEDMSHMYRIINTFDDRWMPNLNDDSFGWIKAYLKKDIPSLKKWDSKSLLIEKFIWQLQQFQRKDLATLSHRKRKKCLNDFSLDLMITAENMKSAIKAYYDIEISPYESRDDFLKIKRKDVLSDSGI